VLFTCLYTDAVVPNVVHGEVDLTGLRRSIQCLDVFQGCVDPLTIGDALWPTLLPHP